jgi:hypothetical protein
MQKLEQSARGRRGVSHTAGITSNGSATARGCLILSRAKADEDTQRTFKKTAKGAWRPFAKPIPKPMWSCGAPMSIASVWVRSCAGYGQRSGSAVKAVVAQRYEWMYVDACLHP